jgi:hypothetical protein
VSLFLLPLALASRSDAELLEEQGRWPEALESWKQCAATERHCARRADLLEPMAADQFAGWAVLTEVRRNYRSLGSAEATRRIEEALAANPGGPAAAELRTWLSNEYARNNQLSALEQIQAGHPDPLGSLLLDKQREEQRRTRDVRLSGGLSALILVAGLLRRSRPLAWTSAGMALGLLGLPPLVLVALYDSTWWRPFLASAGLIALVVLLKARLPLPLLLPAFWSGMLAIGRQGGWW